jgi:hypothetical protein
MVVPSKYVLFTIHCDNTDSLSHPFVRSEEWESVVSGQVGVDREGARQLLSVKGMQSKPLKIISMFLCTHSSHSSTACIMN